MKNSNRHVGDVLISVAIPDYNESDVNAGFIIEIAEQLDREFKFWEILLISEGIGKNYYSELRNVDNIRVVQVKQYTEFYIRRTIAAMEAIGDIVVLTSVTEVNEVDLMLLINKVRDTDNYAVVKRSRKSVFETLLKLIGRITGFQVSLQNMLTSAYPRSIIGQLLGQFSTQIALRFPPIYLGNPESITASVGYTRSFGGLLRRIALIQDLFFSIGPKLLTYVGTLCIVVAICAVSYSIYVILVWVFIETVQPGWVTLSLLMSLGLAFMSTSLFALSAGLKRLIDIASPDYSNYIVGETGSADIYGKIMDTLNVEKFGN